LAHIFAHTLQIGGEDKLDVLAEVMTRKTDKVDLDNDAVLDSQRFHSHRFIDDPTIAFIKRQRLTDGSRGGGDIEQQSRFAQIGLLSEMQPEGAIAQRLRRAFKELCLRVSGDATLTIVKVGF
jgi:hypothetical protein